MTATLVLTALLLVSSVIAVLPSTLIMVKAASATLTLSPTSGRGILQDASGAFDGWSSATEVTITGTGFPAEQENIELRILESGEEVKTTAGLALTLRYWSISGPSPNKVKAGADGSFKVLFRLPSLEAGSYNIFAVYTDESTLTSTPAVFTVLSEMLVLEESMQTSTGVYNSKVHFLLTGFIGGETLTIIPNNFLVSTSFGSTPFTSFTVGADGSTTGSTTNAGYVSAVRPGGTVTVRVFGSEGSEASKTFNINPTVAVDLDNDAVLEPTISIPRLSGTFYLWGRNWQHLTPDIEVDDDSIKIMTSTTTYSTEHKSFEVDDNGKFGPIAVSYDDLSTSPLSLKINDITFSLEAGNLIPPAGLYNAQLNRASSALFPIAGALVASDPARNDRVDLSATSIRHSGRARTAVYVYLINGNASLPWDILWDGAAVTEEGLTTTDVNGAGLVFFWDLPTGAARAFGEHTLTFTGFVGLAGLDETIDVWPYISSFSEARGYRERFYITGNGFDPAENVQVTVGGTSWGTIISILSDGSFSWLCEPIPKLPAGSHSAVFSGEDSDNKYTRSLSIKAVVIRDPSASPSEPLTTNAASVGDPVILRSSVTAGVFGLAGGRVHDVMVAGVKVTTFTSTSDGTIPGAVAFTVPSLKAGLYYVDIIDTTTGKSAIFGLTRYYYPPRSGYTYTGEQFTAYVPGTTQPGYAASSVGNGLLIEIGIKLSVSPTATTPGTAASISGSGLSPSKTYYVTISSSSFALAGPWLGFSLGEFTTTAAGAIPTGVSITIPDVSNTNEVGQAWYIHVSTSGQLADLDSTGQGSVVLYASATITPTAGAQGTQVDLAVKGLTSGHLYNIHFGYDLVDSTVKPGVVVGSVVADTLGKVTTFFTVPTLSANSYDIQFFDTMDLVPNYNVLNTKPVFAITGVVGPPPVGTGTFTPSTPALLDSAGRPVSSVTKNTGFYINVDLQSNVGTDLSIYVIAQVKDAAGNVVAVGLTAADVRGGAKKSVPVAFVGIGNTGTYTATIFVWSGITEPTPWAPTKAFTFTVT